MTCNRNVTLEPVMGIDWTNARVALRIVAGTLKAFSCLTECTQVDMSSW